MNFCERVHKVVLQIPVGKVATYGQIALILGSPRASRVVGYALRNNSMPGVLPCHRVVNRMGRLAPDDIFGPGVQRERLEAEGVQVSQDDVVDLRRYQWSGH